MVDRRLEPHDSNQLELKLSYLLEPGAKRQRYLVESFMFVPRTLGVSAASYKAQRFFEDTSMFVRLKTPQVALEALAKPGRGEHWFDPLREELDSLLGGEKRPPERLVRQLKLLGGIYRTAVRDEGRLLLVRFDALNATDPKSRLAELARYLEQFLDYLDAALARLRLAGARCEHAVVPVTVRDAWAAVDEYVAIQSEEIVTVLVAAADALSDQRELGPALTAARERLADSALAAYRHRRTRGYPSYAVPGETNEELPRRHRILKRIISSVLYLDTTHEEGGTWQRDLIGAIAAAAAMLFAIIVAIWAQIEWGILSSTFIVIMVLSYIVKDRIKEWGKRYLGRRLARWLPDRIVLVREPDSDRVIGQLRESVSVIEPERVDAVIRELRHSEHESSIGQHGRPEVVIRYVKDVVLQSGGLQSALTGVEGLIDIIRFNFGRYRRRMDEPIETYRMVHPAERTIVNVPCHRVYHINLVLRITSGRRGDERSTVERVRVIMNQNGLYRVEAVGGGPAGREGLLDSVIGPSLLSERSS